MIKRKEKNGRKADGLRVSGGGSYSSPLGGEGGERTGKQTAESIMMSVSSNAGGGKMYSIALTMLNMF